MKFGDALSYTFAAAIFGMGTVNLVGSSLQDVDKDAAKIIETKMEAGKPLSGDESKTYYAYNFAEDSKDEGLRQAIIGIAIAGLTMARTPDKKKKDGPTA